MGFSFSLKQSIEKEKKKKNDKASLPCIVYEISLTPRLSSAPSTWDLWHSLALVNQEKRSAMAIGEHLS